MKGDFSRLPDERNQNFAGVLHQQGRVLLDADWNAQTAITSGWQDTAGQDIIGAGVAAVPADQPDGFKIASATHAGGTTNVQLTVKPGRVWADGLLARLFGEPTPESTAAVPRVATYLKPPVQDPLFSTSSIDGSVRDAVVLEVWREEFNGFQWPDLLIEPALGGPDTTERVNTAFAFRLMRLGAGDTCENIAGRLEDDFSKKGKLKVSLLPSNAGAGDCPTPAGGGYTGFEHNFYRIEIAVVDAGPPQFTWSQYGGGLVGRGHFEAPDKVTIKANLQAITNSGLSSFYLEALERDPALGHWRVTYGAPATLSTDVLTLGTKLFGTIPANPLATDTTFFRLWNGIALVQNFLNTELPNNVGINLAFDAATASNYVPGDYWTFSVRAGEVVNPDVLIDTEPPKGIHYHRVPLAVLTWTNTQDVQLPIEDCRHRFQPLTRLACCCSYRVGDGMHSWGDFDKIQDAVDSLPLDEGGEVCVLPGVYHENVKIDKRRNITIKGCGTRSRVVSPAGAGGAAAKPVFHVIESQNIRILALAVEADDMGAGIVLEGRPLEAIIETENGQPPLMEVTLEGLLVRAATRSAIEAHVCYFTTIRGCRIEMKDVATASHGVYFVGDDGLIEDNVIVVPNVDEQVAFFDVVSPLDATKMGSAQAALGGLQLGGTCERVRIVNNLIARGIGQGIVLGSLITISTTTEKPVPQQPPPKLDPCFPCRPGDTSIPGGDTTTRIGSEGDLYDIEIVGNRICNMGLDGIGVAGFFSLGKVDEFISVHGLLIDRNEISRCLRRQLDDILQTMMNAIGYGGIALADVDHLVVRDNVITDNGPDFRQPVCGIFVLHGEGMEISRNHILNNGARDPDSQETASSVKRGPRGGINVLFAVAPVIPITINEKTVPTQDGLPALMVHDNVVSVPLGRALSATALGPVSVVANLFTSRGTSARDEQTFIASTVMILNLGLSNEFYLQLLVFVLLWKGNSTAVGEGRPGLDDELLGKYLSNGNVLFDDNQCSLDLMETGVSLAVSSILILTLDDVGFHDNQCDCNLLVDFVLTQAILMGMSVRATDNRFKEGVLNTLFSAVTIGQFNTTTDNQSTHCLFIRGQPNLTVDHSNVSLMMMNNPRACCRFLVHKEECTSRNGAFA